MGVGEMDQGSFTRFLVATLAPAAARCRDGTIAFICMDWRHMAELLAAGKQVFSELKNLCVWNKTNGGMGSFYRSKHELVFAFKVGSAPHLNTFGLEGDNSHDGDGPRLGRHVFGGQECRFCLRRSLA